MAATEDGWKKGKLKFVNRKCIEFYAILSKILQL